MNGWSWLLLRTPIVERISKIKWFSLTQQKYYTRAWREKDAPFAHIGLGGGFDMGTDIREQIPRGLPNMELNSNGMITVHLVRLLRDTKSLVEEEVFPLKM